LVEEGNPLLFRTKGKVTPTDLKGKGRRSRGLGGREFPGSMHEGLLVITAAQVDPARGSAGALEERGNLHSQVTGTMKKV
jgi:hypothetical protein